MKCSCAGLKESISNINWGLPVLHLIRYGQKNISGWGPWGSECVCISSPICGVPLVQPHPSSQVLFTDRVLVYDVGGSHWLSSVI